MGNVKVRLQNVKINKARVKKLVEPYFKEEVLNLKKEFQKTIKTSTFMWDKETKRKDGTVVYSPRNIYDLGGFYNSLEIVWINPTSAVFVWNVPYAKTIMFGTNKTRGRDWISFTMIQKPFVKFKHERQYLFS
jgi:hypothetical protein